LVAQEEIGVADTLHDSDTSSLGNGVFVRKIRDGKRLTIEVGVKTGAECILHWGLARRTNSVWQRPPAASWPPGTVAADGNAVRTPLPFKTPGEREAAIQFDLPCTASKLVFVLHFPRENRWLKNGAADFMIPLPTGGDGPSSPEEALATWASDGVNQRQQLTLDGGTRLAVTTQAATDVVRVHMACDAEAPLVLQWGLAWQFRHDWQLPPENYRPAGTSVFNQAARTPFADREGMHYLELVFQKPADGPGPRGICFVVYQPEDNAWLKSNGQDLYLALFKNEPDARLGSPELRDLAEEIVAAENGAASWTLMHRFNLCHDLLEKAKDNDGLALLFAWLRYSSIRQLDWQRRFNTKPRELSHAQDRLTTRLAGVWRKLPAGGGRTWVRLMLTTLGRGGDGQRVRDEILHIMHRNQIKETSGSFTEEWHQKLHNNTTPDDVVLCEAYLAFLKSNGDLKRFYQTLEAGGVTRERLKSFERPIKTDPMFFADKKDALIQDFESFLQILKSVHSGTDLQSAAQAVQGRLSEGLKKKLDALLRSSRQPKTAIRELLPAITSVREGLKDLLTTTADDSAVRDLLFLDLALEELVRTLIERQNLSQLDRESLVELVHWTLRNLTLSIDSRELAVSAGHWGALLGRAPNAQARASRDWALHAKSVADRAARWVQHFTHGLYETLQPKAEFLGKAFGVGKWTVPLFSEEVIRGGPVFALSLLLRPLDPLLRKAAGLGGWQVISPARAEGRVRVVDRLTAVQEERFQEATVLITDAVSGAEEIPQGVTAVVTSDTPDLVSHVSVRARNARILFATCFDAAELERLKQLRDRNVVLNTTPGGDVEYHETTTKSEPRMNTDEHRQRQTGIPAVFGPGASAARKSDLPNVITQDKFTPNIVGGKSNNLNGLRGRLPDWIHLPTSVALPFGCFEKALEASPNQELRREYETLLATAESNPAEVLAQVRELLLKMTSPPGLKEELLRTWQAVGLAAVSWEQAWTAIERVWASKWNERAYLSRRARGIPHESLRMAVLIQQVVPADYAFVIHTINPLTGNRDELLAEVVLGMGETLVGNYPGRALAFVCRKADLKLDILSYPGKSLGLYGKGVIFRSDSNGEDLADFAGAGLYDSFLAEEPEHRVLDYRSEKLVWDQGFRDELLRSITRLGVAVEKVLGSAQDIEGAVAGGRCYIVQTRPQVGLDLGH
jgi:alpha-glucan, water dikinase